MIVFRHFAFVWHSDALSVPFDPRPATTIVSAGAATRKRMWGVFAAGIVMLLAQALRAQVSTGDVLGSAQDQSGAVVPNAEVKLLSIETQESRTTVTNETGDIAMPPDLLSVPILLINQELAVPHLHLLPAGADGVLLVQTLRERTLVMYTPRGN